MFTFDPRKDVSAKDVFDLLEANGYYTTPAETCFTVDNEAVKYIGYSNEGKHRYLVAVEDDGAGLYEIVEVMVYLGRNGLVADYTCNRRGDGYKDPDECLEEFEKICN